jgi:nucleoside-diphosphate-sugar epimerase
MKKVLVTGGLGLIGFHFVKALAALNKYDIHIVDNKEYFFEKGLHNYNYYLSLREKELSVLPVNIITAAIDNRDQTRNIYKSISPDFVIHFAGMPVAGVADYYPEAAKKHIFDATFNLLDAFTEKNPEQFIYISSSMVYGNFPKDEKGKIIPPDETAPCNPTDIYGSLKLCCENMVKAFHLRKKLTYTIIRPSAVYGFTDCNFRVTELFTANALLGRPLLLDNGGKHLLDFSYAEDVAAGIIRCVENSKAHNETFNISCGQGRSIYELSQIISKLIPDTIIQNTESKPFRPNRGAMNITKAILWLGYKPAHNLEAGMKLYVEKVKEHIANLDYPEKYY